jgi:carbon storage regulator
MLVLSRQKDETIIIGEDLIKVTVVDIRGDKVRIGIEAPKEMSVHRKEVYDAIRREIREGQKTKPEDAASLINERSREEAARLKAGLPPR